MNKDDAPTLMEAKVTGQVSPGVEVRGVPVYLDRHRVVFESYDAMAVARVSAVLSGFKLEIKGQVFYDGKATITNLLNTGEGALCEVALGETWLDGSLGAVAGQHAGMSGEFQRFLRDWQKLYTVLPQFKAAVADIHTFLTDLRLWLQQVELGLRAVPAERQPEAEAEILHELAPQTSSAIVALLEKYEALLRGVEEPQRAAHQVFARRHIGPLAAQSPFIHRSLVKPLGYAGDYEMVNMMARSPYEGRSLFAKVLNTYALGLPPVVAHRNRLAYLKQKLGEETRRCVIQGHRARVLSVGCGPAWEIQLFLKDDHFSDKLDVTLVDFNEETLAHVSQALEDCKRAHGRATVYRAVKQSVTHMLRHAVKKPQGKASEQYDFIYCAGLFDYLSESTCKAVMEYCYGLMAPGGLLLATNVDDHESRHQMEAFLEWYLIYRNSAAMLALVPAEANRDDVVLWSDETGVNLFLEVRKPRHG